MSSPKRRRLKVQKEQENDPAEKKRREEERLLEEKMELMRFEFENLEKVKQTPDKSLMESEIQVRCPLFPLVNISKAQKYSERIKECKQH